MSKQKQMEIKVGGQVVYTGPGEVAHVILTNTSPTETRPEPVVTARISIALHRFNGKEAFQMNLLVDGRNIGFFNSEQGKWQLYNHSKYRIANNYKNFSTVMQLIEEADCV